MPRPEPMRQCAAMGAQALTFAQAALTAFLPQGWLADEDEIDAPIEADTPGPGTMPLVDAVIVGRAGALAP